MNPDCKSRRRVIGYIKTTNTARIYSYDDNLLISFNLSVFASIRYHPHKFSFNYSVFLWSLSPSPCVHLILLQDVMFTFCFASMRSLIISAKKVSQTFEILAKKIVFLLSSSSLYFWPNNKH